MKAKKLQTLANCMAQWVWLARHPKSSKMQYFYEELGFQPYNLRIPESECYCCEYDKYKNPTTSNIVCTECPLNGYAWVARTSLSNPNSLCCKDPKSPYRAWRLAQTPKEKQTAAWGMVKACQRAINDLLKEEKDS